MLSIVLWLLSFLARALASLPTPENDSPKNSDYVLVPENGILSRTASPGSPAPIQPPTILNPSSLAELSPNTAFSQYLEMVMHTSDSEPLNEEPSLLEDLALASTYVQKDFGVNFEESIAIIQEIVEIDLKETRKAKSSEIEDKKDVVMTQSNWPQPSAASIAIGAFAIIAALAYLKK